MCAEDAVEPEDAGVGSDVVVVVDSGVWGAHRLFVTVEVVVEELDYLFQELNEGVPSLIVGFVVFDPV